MKNLKLVLLGIVLMFSVAAKAQVSVNVNIGSPPMWGPVGYTDVRYYYIPDIEAYYDIETSMFIYYGGGVWLHRSHLPERYAYFDLYDGYKVVITDYRGNEPNIHFKSHKGKYAKGYKGKPQKSIGAKPGKGNSGKSSNGGNGKKTSSGNNGGSGNQKSSGSPKSSGGHKSSGGGGAQKQGGGSPKQGGGNNGPKGGGGGKK